MPLFGYYHRILEEFDSLPEYYCTVSVDLFGFSFRTSSALVNPCVLFMMFRYVSVPACIYMFVIIHTRKRLQYLSSVSTLSEASLSE